MRISLKRVYSQLQFVTDIILTYVSCSALRINGDVA